jgi:phthalate 4,5-cis-dihydrodiol dehydrogenase
MRQLKIGVVGLGQGAANVLPTMRALPETDLVAGADINPRMRAGFLERYPGTRVYDSAAGLFGDSEIDVVWVSTPNRFHCEHAVAAMQAGKHVAVEKPMAVTIEDADRMVETAQRCGVQLLAAHTSSYGLPVRTMRRIARSSELGAVRSILIWSYTDWMLRPRSAEELSSAAGSGVVHRQGPHQIDVLRLLGGGRLHSVRGTTGAWMPERTIPGFFTAYFEFEDGTPAVILFNGYGYFMTGELFPGALDHWRYTDSDRIALRKGLRGGARDEEREKEEYRIGGRFDPTAKADAHEPNPWAPIDLGMLVVSCERGDMRHSRHGVYVYGDDGCKDVDVRAFTRPEKDLEGGATVGALLELYDAVVNGRPVYHSGAWGRATLEATLALIASARERKEILLTRQVALPDDYDAALHVEEALV